MSSFTIADLLVITAAFLPCLVWLDLKMSASFIDARKEK